MQTLELTILMPCLNEAETIQTCVRKARQCLQALGVTGEVLIADNGSTDGSRQLGLDAGARIIVVQERGYGAALRAGIESARGRYIIMGDADDSYDFTSLEPFIRQLRAGHQLVMGNRFRGGIKHNAMPLLHYYIGNPVLSFLGRLFFRINIGDFHCGLRGFDRAAILQLGLSTHGMEFASEMVVKAALARLRITEVPTILSRDGRTRRPHLRTWRDGWRHLRFLLMFSPRWLFLYPGLLLLLTGSILQVTLFFGGVQLGPLGLGVHTMLYSAAMSVIGVQMMWFAVFARVYASKAGLIPFNTRLERILQKITLERGLTAGLSLLAGGLVIAASAVGEWARLGYGELDPRTIMRTTIPSVSMMLIGMEFVMASFFLGLLRTDSTKSYVDVGKSTAVTRAPPVIDY